MRKYIPHKQYSQIKLSFSRSFVKQSCMDLISHDQKNFNSDVTEHEQEKE